MDLPPNCYAFEGDCACSEDADLTLTFDDEDVPLRAHSCLLAMTSPVLKMAVEDCSVGDGVIHMGRDDKNGWVLLLNMIHPISSQIMNRTEIFLSENNRVTLGMLAKKYDIRFILNQMDDMLVQNFSQITGRYDGHLTNFKQTAHRGASPDTQMDQIGYLPSPSHYQAGHQYQAPHQPVYHPYYPSFSSPHYLHCGGTSQQPYMYPFYPLPTARLTPGSASIIKLAEHAALLNLPKTWKQSVEALITRLRGEVPRGYGSEKKLEASGELVKQMLENLRSCGYEKEALDFAIMFFDKF